MREDRVGGEPPRNDQFVRKVSGGSFSGGMAAFTEGDSPASANQLKVKALVILSCGDPICRFAHSPIRDRRGSN